MLKAFLKSMNLMYTGDCHSKDCSSMMRIVSIWSMQDLPALKPTILYIMSKGSGADLEFCVGALNSGSAPPDNIENMDGKMEHSNAIWNANLELQRQVKNKIERVFLHYLKLQRTFWKQGQ